MRPSFFITTNMNDITRNNVLLDRKNEIEVNEFHYVNRNEVKNNYPNNHIEIFLGLGCFWGAERLFWELPYVHVTSVGYGGGFTKNPTYKDICSGLTEHAELVKVVIHNDINIFKKVLKVFWENHDPTQGMRQGNDIGTQYRSCIYINGENFHTIANESKNKYQNILKKNNISKTITTEIKLNKKFYYAEDYHQQYLAKNPLGYCEIQGIGLDFEI